MYPHLFPVGTLQFRFSNSIFYVDHSILTQFLIGLQIRDQCRNALPMVYCMYINHHCKGSHLQVVNPVMRGQLNFHKSQVRWICVKSWKSTGQGFDLDFLRCREFPIVSLLLSTSCPISRTRHKTMQTRSRSKNVRLNCFLSIGSIVDLM